MFIDNRKETEYAGFITHLHLLLHIVTLDIEALVVPWHQFTYSLLVPRTAVPNVHNFAVLQMFVNNFVHNCTRHFRTLFYTSLIVKRRFSRMMRFTFCFNASVMTEGRPDLSASWTSCSPIPKHCAPFSETGRVHNMLAIDCNKSSVNFTGSNVFRLQKPNHASHVTVGGIWYRRVYCHNPLH